MIDDRVLESIANLSRLELSDEQKPRLAQQLTAIMAYVKQLDELDLTGVEPTSHAVEVQNVFRDDVAIATLVSTEILKQAPEAQDGFFRVPRVIG